MQIPHQPGRGDPSAWYVGEAEPVRRRTEHASGLKRGDLPVLCEMQKHHILQLAQLHGCNGGIVRAMCV